MIDSESTYSLIDEQLAQNINCRMQQTKPTSVTMTRGEKLASRDICNPLIWRMQDLKFHQFNYVLLDFIKGSIIFTHECLKMELKSEAINEEFKMMIDTE